MTILLAPLLSLWAQPIEPPPRFERLPSSLRVCVVADPSLPLVGVQLWYRAGSADDPPHQPGLCHVLRTLLEHREQAALRVRAAGLHFESRTLRDACSFETVLPADPNYLAFVLDLEAARMRPLTVTRETLAEAIDAAVRCSSAVCSARSDGDGDGPVIEPRLLSALLPEHSYRHPPSTVAEPVRNVSAEQAGEFLARWFVPGNATLLVIGDVQSDEVMEMIHQRFGGLSPAEPPRRPERRVPERAFAREWIDHGEDFPDSSALRFAWLTPPAASIENAAIDVLMHRLCNPVDGPLHRRLIRAGFRGVRWRRESWRDAGVLMLEVQGAVAQTDDLAGPRSALSWGSSGASGGAASRPSLEQVEQIAREELERVAAERPTEIEFNRARNLAAGAVLEGRAGFAVRARRLGEHELIGGDVLLAEFELPRVQRIPVGAMQSAARALLEAWGEAASVREGLEAHATRDAVQRKEPEARTRQAGERKDGLEDHTTAPGELAPTEILDLLATHAPSLPLPRAAGHRPGEVRRGVCVIRTTGAELAAVAGSGVPRPASVTELRVRLAAGSTRHSSAELRDYLSYHAIRPASLEGAAALVGPKDRVEAMAELWGELLFEPNLDEAALDAACRAVFAGQALAAPAQCADELFENVQMTAAAQIAPRTILAWHERMVGLVNDPTAPMFSVVVLADLDPGATRESVERMFASKAARYFRGEEPAGEDRAPAAPEARTWAGGERPRVFWLPLRGGSVELRVAWPIDVEARADPDYIGPGRELRGAFAAALMGAAFDDHPAALDGTRTRPWRARVLPSWHFGLDRQVVLLSRRSDAGSLASELADVLARVRQIHDPHAPPSPPHAETAMRLAVMALRLRAGLPLGAFRMSEEAVTGAPMEDHQAYWRDWLALASPPQPIVVVVGGDGELRPALEKIGEVTQVGSGQSHQNSQREPAPAR